MKKTLNAILLIVLLAAGIPAYGVLSAKAALRQALDFPASGLEVTVWSPDSQEKIVLDEEETGRLTALLASVRAGGLQEAPGTSSLSGDARTVTLTASGYGSYSFCFLLETGQGYLVRAARDIWLSACVPACDFLRALEP